MAAVYDLLYKNECQNWRNKINRVKNTAGFPADRLEKIQAAFADFKKEALQRKKAVKTGTASPKEFTDWLYQQSNVIIELCEYGYRIIHFPFWLEPSLFIIPDFFMDSI